MGSQKRMYRWALSGLACGAVLLGNAASDTHPVVVAAEPSDGPASTFATTTSMTLADLIAIAPPPSGSPCSYPDDCSPTTTTAAPTTTTTEPATTTTTVPTTTTEPPACLVSWEKVGGTITSQTEFNSDKDQFPRWAQVTEDITVQFTISGCHAASVDTYSFTPGTPTEATFALSCYADISGSGGGSVRTSIAVTIRDSSGSKLPGSIANHPVSQYYTLRPVDNLSACFELVDDLLGV